MIITLIAIISPEVASSQPSFPDDPDQIPVNGGLALLFAAGSGYVINKYRQKKNLCNR